MEEKIIITYDSGLDVAPEIVKQYDIKKIPVILKMGANEALDDGSIEPADIIEYFKREKELAVTSPPSVQDFFRFFTKFTHMGYTVIHISSSSKLSLAYEYAKSASESFSKVHIIDSKGYSIGGMPIVLKASMMLKEGKSAEEIANYCQSMANRVNMHVLISNLDYIHSGGRINISQKLMLSAFGMVPSVSVEDGYFYVRKNYRGHLEKSSAKFTEDTLKNITGVDRKKFFLGHTGIPSSVLEVVKKEINQVYDFDEILVTQCGCSTTTHYGDGGLLLCWVNKE